MAKPRARSIPDSVLGALPLAPNSDKRMTPLAAAQMIDEGWAVVTATTLVVVRDGVAQIEIDWDAVDNANWDNETDTVTVNPVTGAEPLRLKLLSDPEARFATALRERVQSSVVMSEIVDVAPGVTARVALRRTATGRIISQVMGRANLDLRNPEILARVNEAEAQLREHAGLPS